MPRSGFGGAGMRFPVSLVAYGLPNPEKLTPLAALCSQYGVWRLARLALRCATTSIRGAATWIFSVDFPPRPPGRTPGLLRPLARAGIAVWLFH